MKFPKYLYTTAAFIILTCIIVLTVNGIKPVREEFVENIRLEQLSYIKMNVGSDIHPLLQSGNIKVVDYFKEYSSGFTYTGGLKRVPWKVGELYSRGEIESVKPKKTDYTGLLHFPVGHRGLYVNLDHCDKNTIKEFLTVMDQQDGRTIDTLILDFRFMRVMDFGAIIRLFNQIAPPEKITLGYAISKHHTEEILTSGRPFFDVGYTVILVDEAIPIPVRKLIQSFSPYSSYQIKGRLGILQDTVCLFTDFIVGQDIYRICTDRWTGIGKVHSESDGMMEREEMLELESLRYMDSVWYKRQDTVAVKEYISGKVLLE